MRASAFGAVLLLALALGSGCGGDDDLIIGVATSVRDTGLIDELVDEFEVQGADVGAVKPIGAGSGQLLELARRGEVDLIITHDPEGEARLLEDGDGIDRREVMYNTFLLVGPEDDPADVAGSASPQEAFQRIAEAEATFVSRGDRSGTNIRELAIWERDGMDPEGRSWYQESGAGQGQSLLVASDKGAYTLVDSGTWAVLADRTGLVVFVEDTEVPNVYSVIRVDPKLHDVNADGAIAFADFLTSSAARDVIAEFGREERGGALFVPLN